MTQRGGRKRSDSGKADKGREQKRLNDRIAAHITKPGYRKPGSLQTGRSR